MRRDAARAAAWIAAVLCLAATPLAAHPYRTPRTAAGHPDLEGVWDSRSLTPLVRRGFKTLVVPDADATAHERDQNDVETVVAEFRKALPHAPEVGAIQSEWDSNPYLRLARLAGQARSSILIDPADGQLPLRPEVRARLQARRVSEYRTYDDPETRALAERCLGVAGPPMHGGDLLRIVQTPDAVVIAAEAGFEPRIITLVRPGAPPRAPAPPRWGGDAVAHWDGDTLVVETTGFTPGQVFWSNGGRTPLSPQARVTERLSRTAADELLYRFTVDDPANYTRPWSGVMPFRATHARTFEWACHEGNYALRNILAGARRIERDGGVPEAIDGEPPPKAPAP